MCQGRGTGWCGRASRASEALRWLETRAFRLQGLSIFVALLEKSVMLSASRGLLGCNLGVCMCGNSAG